MDDRQAPPWLPGTSAPGLELTLVLILVPLYVIGLALVMATTWLTNLVPHGHLPWPAAQWALTTPIGILGLMAAATLIMALPLVALQSHVWSGRTPAHAMDVTGLPPWVWPKRGPMRPGETARERWLGQGPSAQRASLALLIGAALLAFLLVGALFATLAWPLFQFLRLRCDVYACLPRSDPYSLPILPILVGSETAALVIVRLAWYWWLRRAESSGGVWLRYQNIWWAAALYYVRRPGVTPEAASTALARFGPAGEVPLARTLALCVFAVTPIVLLLAAGIFLQGWLALYWIPG